jgi:putative transposase
MRGRRPRPFCLAPDDLLPLQRVARSRRLPYAQVQHARIALAAAAGRRVGEVAAQHRCDPSTVWRLCRRYEQGGLPRLLADRPRSGSPPRLSPPAARPHR